MSDSEKVLSFVEFLQLSSPDTVLGKMKGYSFVKPTGGVTKSTGGTKLALIVCYITNLVQIFEVII